MSNVKRKSETYTLVLGAIMTAIVIVLQYVGSVTTFFGPFSTAVALVPIVIGAALCGTGIGAWLGFVFGGVVLISGGANLFLSFDVVGTFITVLLKGTLCGLTAGLVYKLLKKVNEWLAVIVAALLCPMVNTAVFLLGCSIFFLPHAEKIAEAAGMSGAGMALFFAMAFGNFALEIATSVILAPIIVRVLKFAKK